MKNLKNIYANGNLISSSNNGIPPLLCTLSNLVTVNLSNNKIEVIPSEWLSYWGSLNASAGVIDRTGDPRVLVVGNPCCLDNKQN